MKSFKLPLVYLSGIITSILTMALVYGILYFTGFNLPGFYIFIVPIGSIITGIVSGLGYALSLRFLNVKSSIAFVLSIGVISLIFYTLTYYMLYVVDTGDTSFVYFFDNMLSNAADSSLTIGKSVKTTVSNTGYWGYAFLALEYAGFVFGNIISLRTRKDMPYCDKCNSYYSAVDTFKIYPELEVLDVSGFDNANKRIIAQKNSLQLKNEYEKIKTKLAGKSLSDSIEYLNSISNIGGRNYFYLVIYVQKCPKCNEYIIKTEITSYMSDEGQFFIEDVDKIKGIEAF